MFFDRLKSLLGLRAHLAHPSGRSVLQFGMIFILPCSLGGTQRIALLATLNFVADNLGDKRTAASLTDQLVDIGHHVDRQDDMRSSGQTLLHTISVT